ncbi:MBL fold metallo-hydrolase [Arsenicitalea aurantiaca]|uniref:MBL fold metallo-hydrolase n=2 Tax=Arsenicitalea aurantiaca TaxID=1783274 RepID=A0A433X8M6_9HYPH|nr:MBL fold metallo-hydrolase [Arsenicitalea aurantiaca]
MVLTWGGHTIYVDPVGGGEAFEGMPAPTGILITHGHGDHFDMPTLEAIGATNVPLLVNQEVYDQLPADMQARASVGVNGEAATLSGININVIPAYNTSSDRLQFHPEGVGNGYVLNLADQRIYIAGDTEDTPEMRALTDIDVAFLPMNLPYTMTEEQAADAVAAFGPRIVYPYHFSGSDPERFAELVGTTAEVRIADWYGPGNADAEPPAPREETAQDAGDEADSEDAQ